MKTEPIPHWDLSNVYPSLDSPEIQTDLQRLIHDIEALEEYFPANIASAGPETEPGRLSTLASGLIDRLNVALELAYTLHAYINSFVSTDSFNKKARKMLSEFEQINVRLQNLQVRTRSWTGKIAGVLPAVLKIAGSAQAHAFYLQESAEQSQYLMSEAEESLASELNLSGANAWGKLQGTVTSQLSIDFELDGRLQKLSMPALINLHSHPDEVVRRRAYEAEMVAWESVSEPLAAAMNGIKGTVNTLNNRRGRSDALHTSLDEARIDRETLEVMLEAMRDSFPVFRMYFQAKAARFGKSKLAWWDIFAPTGKLERRFSFTEAKDFILANFAGFSPHLYDLAQRAFNNSWIDAEQRVGKRGGAFCMSLPAVKESRVLCNFDGSLDQVFTIAHELGHAFHNDCMFKAGKTPLQKNTPMTLAETASIMCETIAVDAALAETHDPQEKLAILESSLIGRSQVIVDIYSRYLFESEVFERRAQSELSADDLCEIMESAQKATYGEALDERYLHKYMWTWKPHYYSASRSFYNYPYAFGLLFGTGLYAIYRQRGADFVADYENLLASTGEARSVDLAERFGIDIRNKSFWENSLQTIQKQIEQYVQI